MKWKKLTAAAVVTVMAATFVTGCGSQQDKKSDTAVKDKLIVGIDNSFPPFGFHDESGELLEFDMDMAREASERLGMTVEFKPISWGNKEAELKSKNVDVLWNNLSITPEQEKNILFSRPYEKSPQILLVLDNAPIHSKTDLADKIVGTQQGGAGFEAIQSEPDVMSSFKELKQYSDLITSFTDLEEGRVDAIVVDKAVAEYYIKKNGAQLRVIDAGYPDIFFGVGMRKDDTELKTKLDNVLENMHKDGTLTKLSEKWFGIDVSM